MSGLANFFSGRTTHNTHADNSDITHFVASIEKSYRETIKLPLEPS
jgi:hypothetical protein